ncbi:ATP-binding protein [Oceanirhabdus sp. W0125-5]|uniref:ATP-binding protein n=1 Tax=Oceanirhabdus sp. W0125-5 TaxID=2999116 RepID=UPI0022F34012|nr:ATP-binding protein [Oceanirhabdus sp. W0125-5]WBW96925.1 ATP-binding protein [Oceanirhabdus sp. W0125-5]
MNIGILSGKGGTGKTTVATNLAQLWNGTYIDCDVEEPNGFIFLKPQIENEFPVHVEYPIIDDDKCNNCGKCSEVCMFNALANVGEDIMLFSKLCHGCGACEIICPENAISYGKRKIGVIQQGFIDEAGMEAYSGILNIGEPMAVPIIKKLLDKVLNNKGETIGTVNIIDCAPGTSCNIVNTLEYLDCAIVVGESTEFSLSDMKRMITLLKEQGIPFGVVVNKYEKGSELIHEYCNKENFKVLGVLPYSKIAAEKYSMGENLISIYEYRKCFQEIIRSCKEVFSWN